MKNITYLIGAGASAKALPLIKKNLDPKLSGLPDELRNFVNTHRTSILNFNNWTDTNVLDDIIAKCIEFGTPDLCAKYLLETEDYEKYTTLKSLISSYFKFKQDFDKKFDIRVLTFLTTISKDQKLPSNVKVLSWNYDSQFEIAAEKMRSTRSKVYSKLKGFSTWPNTQDNSESTDDNEVPFLCHLNGIAGYNYSKRVFSERINDNFHFETNKDKEILLSFAWENEADQTKELFHKQRLSILKSIAEKTEILVIIGYSFPFFNREIDKLIFGNMSGSLEKIYFQDPYNDGSQLEGQFDNIDQTVLSKIVYISQVDNYHIPFEL